MKKSILSLFALALLLVACSQVKTTDQIIKELHTSGEYTKATAMIDSIIAVNGDDIDKNYRYIFIKDSLWPRYVTTSARPKTKFWNM